MLYKPFFHRIECLNSMYKRIIYQIEWSYSRAIWMCYKWVELYLMYKRIFVEKGKLYMG